MIREKHYIPSYEEIEKYERMMTPDELEMSLVRAEHVLATEEREDEPVAEMIETPDFRIAIPDGFTIPEASQEKLSQIKHGMEEFFGISIDRRIPLILRRDETGGGYVRQAARPEESAIVVNLWPGETEPSEFMWDRTIAHELGHLMGDRWRGNQTHPAVMVLDEGMANYSSRLVCERIDPSSSGEISFAELTRQLVSESTDVDLKKLISTEQLYSYAFMKQGDSIEDEFRFMLPYRAGPVLVEQLLKHFDREKVRMFFRYATEGPDYFGEPAYDQQWMQDNFRRAVEKYLVTTTAKLDRLWRDALFTY